MSQSKRQIFSALSLEDLLVIAHFIRGRNATGGKLEANGKTLSRFSWETAKPEYPIVTLLGRGMVEVHGARDSFDWSVQDAVRVAVKALNRSKGRRRSSRKAR